MKLFSKRRNAPNSVALKKPVTPIGPPQTSPSSVSTSVSLGAGNMSFDGSTVESFVPSPSHKNTRPSLQDNNMSPSRRGASLLNVLKEPLEKILHSPLEKILHKPIVFKRDRVAFLRVTDLKIDESKSVYSTANSETCSHSSLTNGESESIYPNFHHVSHEPPPGVDVDFSERWVALDDGEGQHAPMAPFAVEALVQSARMSTLHDRAMWKPDGKTAKLEKNPNHWAACSWELQEVDAPPSTTTTTDTSSDNTCTTTCTIPHSELLPAPGSPEEEQILMWSGNYSHGFYGSDLPAVRSACIMPTSAKALMELFVDSNRVHEYNKLSLGREDLLVLQDNMSPDGPFGGITKVCRSLSSPPLIRKTLQFTSLLHARARPNGGYKLVTRAVERADAHHNTALKSEILLGVNVILPIDENRCLLILVNHIRSPMVPMMVAKRIGLQAAVGFIHDVRACCT